MTVFCKRCMLISLSILSTAGWAEVVPVSAPSAPSAQPSALASIQPSPLPELSTVEMKRLEKAFAKSLTAQYVALVRKQKAEMKDLVASQDSRTKDWKANEKAAIKKVFSELRGKEARPFMRDRDHRYNAFKQLLADERSERKREQQVRLDALKAEQMQRFKEFSEYLTRKETPPQRLWP